mgnify:CR=1 FL=1
MRIASCLLGSLLLVSMPPLALAEVFTLGPQQGLIGEPGMMLSHHEDTLPDIARLHHLGFDAIVAANPGVDTWLPGEGTHVNLPTQRIVPDVPHAGIVVNLSEGRLYYFRQDRAGKPVVETYPVSVGQVGRTMPLGVTKVVGKQKKPTWYPPKSIRDRHVQEGDPLPAFVPPGPENPLGEYALRLGIPSGSYLIHGTNKPVSVGLQITNGCIRLYPEDIETLFREVPVGVPVRIINQRIKTGWSEDGVLYLEVHHPLDGTEAGNVEDLTSLTRQIVAATSQRSVIIDWDAAERAFNEQRGEPVRISVDRWVEPEKPARRGR